MADSLTTLLKNTTIADDDPSELLKAANDRLKHSKKDLQAQHTRLVALIKLDRYDDAARAVADGGDPLKHHAPLECAYALYKDGQLDRAREVIRGDEKDRGMLHLQAQVAYRSEEFALAADLYEALGRQAEDDAEESDLRINSGATDAQLAWAGQGHLARKTGHDRVDQEQFETAFNAACRYIARGELRQAHVQLGLARDLLIATDLTDDEKQSEMLPITVQRVYVLCRLGKLEEAEKLCSEVDINSLTDPATRHIGQSNKLLASSKPANPYLSHRFFQATSTIPKNDLPFKFQSSAIQRNSLALDLQAGKYGSINSPPPRGSSSESLTAHAPFGVFNAAAKARNQTGKAALKEIVPMLEKRPHDLGLLLTVVQLYMLTNNVGTATSLVESFIARMEASNEAGSQDARFAPGLVAILVSLYARQSRNTQTKTELAKAASYWRHKSKEAGQSSSLLKAAGATLLNSPSTDDRRSANDLFRNAYESDPNDPVVIAGLVASQEDENVANLAEKLPPIAELIAGIDADALEAAGIAQLEATKVETSRKRKGPDSQAQPTTPKKIKPSRLPKDYDPNKKPDPERWLPLKDRSYYRPKGKKKAKGGGMATQGGVVQEEGRPGTPNQQQQQKAGGPSKSKKKKGKGGK